MFNRTKYTLLTNDLDDICLIEAIRHLWFFSIDQDVQNLKLAKRFIIRIQKTHPQKKLTRWERASLEDEKQIKKISDEVDEQMKFY